MRESKKTITRLLLNNWGGISRQVMELNEYVNLFSGMSGSGKSTVMDAIQVLLYGSLSQTFLNKAADERNRRTVLTYLRGAQKDGTSNRGSRDFCANLAMEIYDTADDTWRCIGAAFEVRREDSEISRYAFFSHDGRLDDSLYCSSQGIPLMIKDLSLLVKSHQKDPMGRGRGEDINRVYPTNDAYQSVLYGPILGYIDGRRFATMEKSAVALKMSNGVGQFIKDYMFPKSSNEAIEKISQQLGAYREIRDIVRDMEKRIGLLEKIREKDGLLTQAKAGILADEYILRRLRVLDAQGRLESLRLEGNGLLMRERSLTEKRDGLKTQSERLHEELVALESELKSSDYGKLEEQLSQMKETMALLEKNRDLWEKILASLGKWEENEPVYDFMGNRALQALGELRDGRVDAGSLKELRDGLRETLEEVNEARDGLAMERRELLKELKEMGERLEDWKNGQKSYRGRRGLKEARQALEDALFRETGKKCRVSILADTFDVKDARWREALEGRLGRVKYSLVTPPSFSHRAAVLFRDMKEYENVDLLHVENILKDGPQVKEGSLYETVETDIDYVDGCLRHFLGRVIRCETVEELEQVREGVTADCYSYSNYTLRHLPARDCRENACIGRTISRARIERLEQEMKEKEADRKRLESQIRRLEEARSFECLGQEDGYYLDLAGAGEELGRVREKSRRVREEMERLEKGAMAQLKERLSAARQAYGQRNQEWSRTETELAGVKASLGVNRAEIENQERMLGEAMEGFSPDGQADALIAGRLEKRTLSALRAETQRELEGLKSQAEELVNERLRARFAFNKEYSALGLVGTEADNKPYDELYERYQKEYVSEYKAQFEEQCRLVYRSLRDNVIASIHGDIKAAFRQVREVNRVLGATSFYDSVYKIGITPAANENGQFYEMLMAQELDSKASGDGGMEGQISFGDDVFQRTYEREIALLVEKFIPERSGDEREAAKKRAEMERYADYRNYLSFNMYEVTVNERGEEKRIPVDEMAGNDSGGEGQNPKYVALFAGFALLFATQAHRDSRVKVVLLDEAFSKMDKTRSSVCLNYARQLGLQVIICVPDERLMTLVKNVDCVYGFRRFKNQISMMMIDKGKYLELLKGEEADGQEKEGKYGEDHAAGMDPGEE